MQSNLGCSDEGMKPTLLPFEHGIPLVVVTCFFFANLFVFKSTCFSMGQASCSCKADALPTSSVVCSELAALFFLFFSFNASTTSFFSSTSFYPLHVPYNNLLVLSEA
jgi:hypothetical protein